MTYNWDAQDRRRCTAEKRDGNPCRAWAAWGDPRQFCRSNGGVSPTTGKTKKRATSRAGATHTRSRIGPEVDSAAGRTNQSWPGIRLRQ